MRTFLGITGNTRNINGATAGEAAAPNKRRQLRGDWGTGADGSTY